MTIHQYINYKQLISYFFIKLAIVVAKYSWWGMTGTELRTIRQAILQLAETGGIRQMVQFK